MRERVALLGGVLHAGPDPDGGFTVAADLPIAEPPSPAAAPDPAPSGSAESVPGPAQPGRAASAPAPAASRSTAVGPEYDAGSGSVE
jgi:hypothetical protein